MPKLAKVLVVDDDTTSTFLTSHLLNRLAVTEHLLVAHNGVEAFQALQQLGGEATEVAGPVLVLLDVNMPVMNGADFLETYQQHLRAQQQQLVVVVLTSSEQCRNLDRIKALQVAADILPKPLTREKVAYILDRHF